MINSVRATTLAVVRETKMVRIRQERVERIAHAWAKNGVRAPPWPKRIHLETKHEEQMLDYLFLLDALNFCFWSKSVKWHIIYRGKKYNGYVAFALALKRFFEEHPEKASLRYFTTISRREFYSIFTGGGELQFLKKRWEIARAMSGAIMQKYGGSSHRFVVLARKRFARLVPAIVRDVPYFNDVARYRGRKVYFLKRAQILAADISGAFGNKGIGYFQDSDYLTAFADYKLPQILHHWGVLSYAPELEDKIRQGVIIPQGSAAEVEIRSATIWAVEYLRLALARFGRTLHAWQIDWILWNKSKKASMRIPHHLTKTIFY